MHLRLQIDVAFSQTVFNSPHVTNRPTFDAAIDLGSVYRRNPTTTRLKMYELQISLKEDFAHQLGNMLCAQW
ncbi:hypothetical protein M404DRAFT_993079 [Pisolithus tinctorius Marx 270]|uniref:Uncharacterized protein n=1 Tax=Pisolithus tinctorius Marx 270 TaxID=870435 RepID=A0A0C3PHK6_PISTI|nr:hypothetical protein M404DRAFT_993079 [Pisolithus tinctorius Marx 270]